MGTWYDGYDVYEDNEGVFLSDTFTGVGPPRESAWHNIDLGPLYQTEPQSPSARDVGAWLPLAAYGTGLALGNTYDKGGIADALTPNVNSVAMEGPMRFAGRGIPKYSNDGIHKDAPDYYPGLPGPELIPMPMPRFPIRPPLAAEPYIPPAHIGRHPPDSTMIVPEVVYPPEDTRSEWEKWRDSFKDDWRAK